MMSLLRTIIKPVGVVFSMVMVFSGSLVEGAALTAAEIQQYQDDLGVTLTATQQVQIAALAKPDGPLPQWRMDAEARIESNRKVDLNVQVVDSEGNPVVGAQVVVKQNDSAFKFGGVMRVKDLTDVDGKLQITTSRFQEIFLKLYNSAGLNNGFKSKQRAGLEEYLPGFLSWAQANNLPVRGHTLIWPGTPSSNHMPADILADVEAVEAAIAAGDPQSTIDALKAALKLNVDAEIAEWSSLWSVYEWDVMNEAIGNHRVQELIGYDQEAEWFNIAASNAVQPGCKMLVNEYQVISARSTGLSPSHYTDRSADYKEIIDRIIVDGGQLDRIGFQSRIKFEMPSPQTYYDRLEDFGSTYGLEMVGTEFEVRDTNPDNPNWFPYEYTEEERAQVTEEILTAYYSHPRVTGLTSWTYMGPDAYAMCEYDGTMKLNALVWYYLHRIRYTTNESRASDGLGGASVRAFKGDYDITVSYEGSDYPATLTLASNQTTVVVLNDVMVDPAPESTLAWVALESWDYAGVTNGTALNGTGTESATDSGLKWGSSDLAVISSQMQRWEYDGVTKSAFEDPVTSGSPYENATTGIYQVSYDVVSADFSNTAAANGKAQFGYGIRDSLQAVNNDRNGTLLVRYDGAAANNRFRLSLSAGSTVQQTIVDASSISNLHVRAVYDLDNAGSAGSFMGYYSINGGAETAVSNSLASGFTLETLRMHIQTINGNNSWAIGDVVMIDNIVLAEQQLVITPESYYAFWLTENPGLTSTNLGDHGDGDGYDNLYEYAFGGDPANGADTGYPQNFQTVEDGGSNYIEYVYTKRSDAADRGLTYLLELSTDLASNIWANDGYTVTGSNDVNAAFQTITNRVPITNDDNRFIRLQVEYQ